MVTVMTVIDRATQKVVFNGLVEPNHKGEVSVPYNIKLDTEKEYGIVITTELH